MTPDEAYHKAEQCIATAQQEEATKLDLSNLGLTEIPETIGKLINLKILNLGYRGLGSLKEIEGNKYSYVEGFQRNRLKVLPKSLGNLSQLKELNLSQNQLITLPDSLCKLSQLEKLSVSFNKLTGFPECFNKLSNLKEIDFSSNKVSKFPCFIRHLKYLEELFFRGNEIKVLPEWIGDLNSLYNIQCGGNKIESLPNSLVKLTNLWNLNFGDDLGGNPLESLPEFIGELSKLDSLWAAKCQLKELPAAIGSLPSLKSIYIHDNPLNPELAAAYEQGCEALMTYLRAKAEASVVLNEAKLILVGEGEVGKTCLLGALRGDAWVEGRPTTHGIEIKPVTVATADGTEIILNGWDFGGQRVYRPTHQLFFSAPAVYLVVWKPREGPQQGFVKEWIALIKHREPEAKILVVATHGGPSQRQPDIDRQELIDLFGEETIQGFFFIDSKPDAATGECRGIKALREKISKVAAALPGMGRTIPAKWHQVREALKATGRPYLPYQDVIAICQEQGVEGFLAELCIRVYHTLGNIVHYHYDDLLKDIVILKPDWLTKAISFVLDDKLTRDRNGLVEFSHLSQLWQKPPFPGEDGYPSELHPIFLRLMERFDLSYKVVLDPQQPNVSSTSLIAQLVPDNRPSTIPWGETVAPGEGQQTQICRIVDERGQLANAEGLFYQLIVRLHKYSLGRDNYADSVHWQRGLMLDDDYNGRALLEHVGTNVRITVRAVYPQFFLSQLTREVKWLVEHFWEGLRCEIVVPCIAPCGLNQPGLGQFEVEKLIASKKKGRPEFPCSVSGCDEWQNIDELMRNAPTAPTVGESLLGNQLSEVQSQIQQVRQDIRVLDRRDQKRFQSLDRGQKKLLSQVDQQFATLLQLFTDEAKEGPRLFSFKPIDPGFFDRPKWISEQFQLTLWCEHSRQPLPRLNADAPRKGIYQLSLTRAWLTEAAPYLKFMMTTIGLVLPVAGAATKVILDDKAYKRIEDELNLGEKSLDSLLQGNEKTIDWLSQSNDPKFEQGEAIRAQGSLLRQLHSFLDEEDPSFGGLVRVQNRRREFLWVHPQFVGEY